MFLFLLPLLAAAALSDVAWLKDLVTFCSLIAGIGGAGLSLYKIHTWTIGSTGRYKAWKAKRLERKLENERMPELVRTLITDLSAFQEQFERVLGSDSTLAEDVTFLKQQESSRFWLQRRAAFRCKDDGNAYKISRAFMELASTMSEQDLFRTGWKRLASGDAHSMRAWAADWQEAAKTNSPHSGELDLEDLRGHSIGRWLLQVVPLGTDRGSRTWEVVLYPANTEALELARARNLEER
jgi:hypothetical protein